MIRLEPLTGHHDRNGFDCSVKPLNTWLRQTALQHQSKGILRTFVAVPNDDATIHKYLALGYREISTESVLGFYALTSAFVLLDELPPELGKRYPRQIPVTRLGRLGIRSELQGQGLGKLLLADAIGRARTAAQAVGSAGIIVDAKHDAAAAFYRRYGFARCEAGGLKLFLAMW
jgi:ribosomal protein S18 acetylase RimI-like enzyme